MRYEISLLLSTAVSTAVNLANETGLLVREANDPRSSCVLCKYRCSVEPKLAGKPVRVACFAISVLTLGFATQSTVHASNVALQAATENMHLLMHLGLQVKQLADEIIAHIREVAGAEAMLAAYTEARKSVTATRMERKRRTAMQVWNLAL